MRKRFQTMLLCSCLIISALVGCTPKTTLNTESESISESMSSELETEQESSGVSTEQSESESTENFESETIEPNESESESESQKPSETKKPSESESEKESETESKKPNNSESENQSEKKDVYIVEWGHNETELIFLGTKYGVDCYKYISEFWDIYSDGSRVLATSNITYPLENRSNFRATDEELLPEALEMLKASQSFNAELLSYINEARARHAGEILYSNTYERDIIEYDETGLGICVGTEVVTETILGGGTPLILSEDLCKAAAIRAVEIWYSGNRYYTQLHRRADGRDFNVFDCFDSDLCIKEENLFESHLHFPNPSGVVEVWEGMPSDSYVEEHINMLSSQHTEIGLCYNYEDGVWVVLFR